MFHEEHAIAVPEKLTRNSGHLSSTHAKLLSAFGKLCQRGGKDLAMISRHARLVPAGEFSPGGTRKSPGLTKGVIGRYQPVSGTALASNPLILHYIATQLLHATEAAMWGGVSFALPSSRRQT